MRELYLEVSDGVGHFLKQDTLKSFKINSKVTCNYHVISKITCLKFQSIKKLVDRIRHIQLMNNRILSVLNKYNSSDGSVTSTIPLEEVKYFPPPIRNIQ